MMYFGLVYSWLMCMTVSLDEPVLTCCSVILPVISYCIQEVDAILGTLIEGLFFCVTAPAETASKSHISDRILTAENGELLMYGLD